ncbi:MAG TPA: ABC transporter permease [Bryobacteraceae bacterium]|nr:ABC transporter permease [Bryobacteraceae bacterium]
MRLLRTWIKRLAGLLPSAARERDLSDELSAHLQLHTDDNLRRGLTPEQARREALIKLGGIESTKELYRDRRTVPILENLLQDLRFAARQLRKSPAFAVTAVVMLALGLCASVAIFAFVDAALIQPLPYQNPSRLVAVYESVSLCHLCDVSYPDYLDWKRLNTVFTSMDMYQSDGYILKSATRAEIARGARVTAGFFRTLGVTPALGRDFLPNEDQPQAPRTAMLSYAAWQTRYGGKPDVLGQSVTLDGDVNLIIGVLPPDFHFAPVGRAEFWTAMHPTSRCDHERGCHDLFGVARLKEGVSLKSAASNMAVIARQLEQQYRKSNEGQGSAVISLTEAVVGDIGPILLVLLAGAGLLLLIASVNVASLLFVRSESRRREMAVRTGLGASPTRLVTQIATEGLLLASIGAAIGLAAASWAMHLLAKLIPSTMLTGMPYLNNLGLNSRVLIFAAAVAVTAALLFTILPSLQLSRPDIREGLNEAGRGSAGTLWRRVGAHLVVLELATAVVLLVGAGLIGKSLYEVLRVDLGMQPDHLATLRVTAPDATYGRKTQAITLGRQLLGRIANLPGVESAALTTRLPLIDGMTVWIQIPGRSFGREHNEVTERIVSAAYFQTLRAKLMRGRQFAETDDASKPPVVIVDRSLAAMYFPGEDPVGKQLIYAARPEIDPMQIVGVVDDIKEGALDKATWPTIYLPFNQSPRDYFSLVVRTSQAEEAVFPTLARTINQLDPEITTSDARTMSDRVRNSPAAYLRRSSTWLVGGFAALALLLGTIGLYGVIAYSVSQRTREIGVRMALGAQPASVYRLILKEAVLLIALGLAAGIACSMAATNLMRGLLFGVASHDATILGSVAAILALSALTATYIPAHRAAKVNPVDALRAE